MAKKHKDKKREQEEREQYKKLFTSYKRNIVTKKIKPFNAEKTLIVLITLIFVALIAVSQPNTLETIKEKITGLTIQGQQTAEYTDVIGKNFYDSTNYTWTPTHEGKIISLKISGTLIGDNARVSFDKNNTEYLVFDNSVVNKKQQEITGHFTSDLNDLKINDNRKSENKTIQTKLEYQKGTVFDADDNGIESVYSAIDFVTKDTFNWDVDQNRLCTRWEIESLDNFTITDLCYGNKACCNFIDLEPVSDSWDDAFYLLFGKYSATYKNLVSAQAIYYDDISAEVYYSDWSSLPAEFVEEEYVKPEKFKDACIQTCILSDIGQPNYTLNIDLINTTLVIESITYVLEKQSIGSNQTANETAPTGEIERTAPTWSSIINNASDSTMFNDHVNWSANISDETGLSFAWLEENATTRNISGIPILSNQSVISINGTSYDVGAWVPIAMAHGGPVCARFWFNDTSNNINVTDWSCFNVARLEDNTTPIWNNITNDASNATHTNGFVNWTADLSDDIGLSFAVLMVNDTGIYVNESFDAIGGKSYNFSRSRQIAAAVGSYVCGRIWFDDIGNNANITEESCFTVANDSCTPPAVNNDWVVQCSDNCVINNMNIDLGTGRLIIRGSGSFTLDSVNISYSNLVLEFDNCRYVRRNNVREIQT